MNNLEHALGQWPNAPLALVLAQVCFDPEVDTECEDVASRLKVALGDRLPSMKAVRQRAFIFSNITTSVDESGGNDVVVGRELRSEDGRCALRVQEGVMTFTTSIYHDSPRFLAEWHSMLGCLCSKGGVKVLRLGLRYVDFIIPAAGKMPEAYFKDDFTCSSKFFGEPAQVSFVSHEYPRGEDGMMRVQYGRGYAPPSLPPDLDGSVVLPRVLTEKYMGGASAVLDIDSWRTDFRRLSADEIADEFRGLRDDVSQAFRKIITPGAVIEWSSSNLV